MEEFKPLTNLQVELLKLFRFEVSEKELVEIKALLGKYFAEKASDQMDQLWEEENWSEETISAWSKERMRTPYK